MTGANANPWRAESDPVKLAVLGKLAEELGEFTQAVARCIIQGIDNKHPVTGKPNLEWLYEELTDVKNMMEFVDKIWKQPNPGDWEERLKRKRAHINQWLDYLGRP